MIADIDDDRILGFATTVENVHQIANQRIEAAQAVVIVRYHLSHAGRIDPDYDLTLSKLAKEAAKRDIVGGLDLTRVIAQADAAVKQAYERMRQPARFELYDLVNDPYEFHDLSDSPEHTDILRELQGELYAWREQTNDPLLDPGNLEQLSAEVRSVTKKNAGKTFPWKYPKYLPSPLLP